MSPIRPGNAPCSWGSLEFEGMQGKAIGYAQMLDELAATGYRGTELGDWGFMPTDPAALHKELETRRLTMLGAFGPVALSDFRRILDVALTAWVPTFLRGDEEDRASSATPELELERTQMHTLVATFVADLEPIHRAVLLGKSQGMADSELAQRAGRSRPWLADRKAEVLARAQSDVIEQLPDGLHDDAFRHMLDECAALEEVDP